MDDNQPTAKALWDAERKIMAEKHPDWPMPAWSRAPAWRKRPYILENEPHVEQS
jgi:hypothetical protein